MYRIIDFVIPQHRKKITGKLLNKIKKKDVYDLKKPSLEIMCSFAKLVECEIIIKRRIVRLIQKFHARVAAEEV